MPALEMLDKACMNASGFLSYHEANILTQTLLSLKKQTIPVYGVHDCLIVRVSDKKAAVQTYRKIIQEYASKVPPDLNAEPLHSSVGLSVQSQMNGKVRLNSTYNL